MIRVECHFPIYEINGKETHINRPELVVSSHWNREELVVLELQTGKLTVKASDLRTAIDNATKTAKY